MIAMAEFPAKKKGHNSSLSELLHIFSSKLANGNFLTKIYHQSPPESST